MTCTREAHEELKLDATRWSTMPLIGYQPTVDDNDQPCALEMRNCSCGSTLCIEVRS